jgi:hypothetical protein
MKTLLDYYELFMRVAITVLKTFALDYTPNKDISDKDSYPHERPLIEAQTIYEWRRLFNLMNIIHA